MDFSSTDKKMLHTLFKLTFLIWTNYKHGSQENMFQITMPVFHKIIRGAPNQPSQSILRDNLLLRCQMCSQPALQQNTGICSMWCKDCHRLG